jgi:septum formation protein
LKNLRPIILASNSPRRKQLLSEAGIEFIVKSKNVEEVYSSDLEAVEIPLYLSKIKALAFKAEINHEIVISADTIVCLGKKILEKPLDSEHAVSMLMELSGNVHEVITAVSFMDKDKLESFHEVTQVHFHPISEKDIRYYVEKYQPLDKAGAYGIQEFIGLIGIKKIVGSHYNVMGLPIDKVYQKLQEWNAI